MSRLLWDKAGDRRFEGGVDRGVLFTTGGLGVAWNGLTSVKEGPSGGETSGYYLDGLRYLNIQSREEMTGTIEAFTYPDEFGVHDGTLHFGNGLIAMQQKRVPFGLSYRTRVGNDVDGQDHGYKLHIIYNMLADPSDKTYSTFGNSTDPSSFSWSYTTLAIRPKSTVPMAPLAHVVIDSTKTAPWLLRYVEDTLYGTSKSLPQLIDLDALFALFQSARVVLSIFAEPDIGLNPLVLQDDGTGDLFGDPDSGLYSMPTDSRLVPTGVDGFYRLESTS